MITTATVGCLCAIELVRLVAWCRKQRALVDTPRTYDEHTRIYLTGRYVTRAIDSLTERMRNAEHRLDTAGRRLAAIEAKETQL